ncbi:MAG TPA: nucleotide exchange factor GrpE [Casimicrobiaceae bacterium]|nr:nucleotide exchange factor GrpE [Casimicrobiaceae bacterium]
MTAREPRHASDRRGPDAEASRDGADRTADPMTDEAVHNNGSPEEGALQKALAEAAEMKDAWLRARADVENVRRQGQSDIAKAHKYAIEKFASDLLPVKDALEQTLAAGESVSADTLKSGADLTLKSLDAAFGRAAIREIDPTGQKFDPHLHQAMQVVQSDLPPNTVVKVLQKGYLLNDRVLRPALVIVSKTPDR